ncbi:MAG: hypothetical protein WCT03_17215 [Candidatus Obscuribacterales bacterium]|jgi:hypothetical protein
MESWKTKQVMEFLKCKRGAINGLVKRGQLKRVKVGNTHLFVADQVKALLAGEGAK